MIEFKIIFTIFVVATHYYLYIITLLFIIIIYNETYHVNKGVIISISNITSIITLALPKSDNNK